MRRRTQFLLATPLVLLVLVWLGGVWLLGSTAGTRFILAQAAEAMNGRLRYEVLSGNLSEGVVLNGLQFEADGTRLAAPRLELMIDYSLLPPALEIRRLAAPELVVQLPDSKAADESDLAEMLRGLALPLPVTVDSAVVRNLRLLDAEGKDLVHLDEIRFSGVIHEGVDRLDLVIDGTGFSARVTGEVDFHTRLAHDLAGTLRFNGTRFMEGLPPGIAWDFSLQGDATSTHIRVAGSPPELLLEGQVTDPLSRPVLDSQFTLGQWVLPMGDPSPAELNQAQGRLGLDADGFLLEAGGSVTVDEVGEVAFDLAGRGDVEGFAVESLAASTPFAALAATGTLAWTDTIEVKLDTAIRRLDIRHWLREWPEAHPLAGRLTFDWRGEEIVIPDVSLTAQDTGFTVTGSAEIDPVEEVLQASLAWREFSWPLGEEASLFTMDSGAIDVAGQPSDWEMQGRVALETPDYPGGVFLLSGAGSLESAEFLIDQGQALGGTLSGSAAVDWLEALRWSATLQVEQMDLGAVWPDYPIRLSGGLEVRQDSATEELWLRLVALRGQIEDSPFVAEGGLTFKRDDLVFEELRLQAGTSRVALDGDMQSPDGIVFDVDVSRPGWLSRQVGGNLSGTGRYAPTRANPFDDIRLQGSDLVLGELGVAALSIESGGRNGPRRYDVKAIASGLNFGDTSLDELFMEARGVPGQQEVLMALRVRDKSLRFGLVGDIVDWADPLESGWRGEIQRLSLVLDDKEALRLRAPTGLSVSTVALDLQYACLDAVEGGALCLALNTDPGTGITLTGELEDLPLDIGKLFFDLDLEFSQELAGEFSWRMAPGGKPSGHAAIEISAGKFGDVEDDDQLVSTGRGYFGFEMRDGDLRSGRAELPLPGIGGIDVDFELTDLALDGSGRIDGTAQVNFSDLGFVQNLTTGLDNVQGILRSTVSISGLTGDPQFDGDLAVSGAGFEYPYLGMQVKDLNLNGRVDDQDRAALDGALRMGEGEGKLSLRADFSEFQNPRMDLILSGEALRVAGLPDLEVDVDTVVELGWQGGAWEIDGYVEVPHARVEPITSISTRIAEHEDLRLVAGQMPPAPAKADAGELALIGQLAVRFGDDVRLRADIADLAFGGGLDLDWQNTLMPVANGAIEVTGLVTAWGPQLHMVNSRVRFPGVLVNQPVLDIRAERDVFGNTIVRSAGVRVGGNWRRPDVEAYTIPLTTRDRAWAVLITGSDVEFGQGVGALDVGTYIAPRIYMSYGVSLFDTENVVGIRYDLKKGWGVKATSSQRESGVDISYTIEH